MSSPAASDDGFTHEPLPDPANYMRLLEVLDDNYSKTTKVRCRLTSWPLDNMPPYHAISYTWGDPNSCTFILVNDRTLQVRTNCEFALKQAHWYSRGQSSLCKNGGARLYRESKPEWYRESRYIWLDAICIDQENLNEKSKQVAMMGNIYKKASHVLACIGDHADDSLLLFHTLYGPMHHFVDARSIFRPNYLWNEMTEENNEKERIARTNGISRKFRMLHRYSTTHRVILALGRLAMRPYFTRMWILQELQLAQSISILCGDYVFPKEDAIHLLDGVSQELKHWIQDDLLVPQRESWASYSEYSKHRVLRRLVNGGMPHPAWHGDWLYTHVRRQCATTVVTLQQRHRAVKSNIFQLLNDIVYRLDCTDPRDKVYGLLSLIDWGDVAPLEPDYTHTDIEVAVEFIERIMKLGEAQELDEPILKYILIIVKLFNFKNKPRSLAEALEARRGYTEDCGLETTATPIGGPKVQVDAPGWRLSPVDIDRNTSRLQRLQGKPPDSVADDDALYLPRQARADDWVVEVDTVQANDTWYRISDARYLKDPPYAPLLIMREGVIMGSSNTFVGYGFYSPRRRPHFKLEKGCSISISFDIEDAIIFFWRMKQLYEMDPDARDWILDYLDVGVCKQLTPRSSYGKLPLEVPTRTERYEPPKYEDYTESDRSQALLGLRNRKFVLFDTKSHRGWLVNGEVVALHLLCAYLKNHTQTPPFDFSKLNHFNHKTRTNPFWMLDDFGNLKTTIYRKFEDTIEHPGYGTSSAGQATVQEELLLDLAWDIFRLLLGMSPQPSWRLFKNPFANRRNVVVKGWDFEQLYRNRKARVCEHKFDKDPGWLHLMEHFRAKFIFGSDFGEVIPHEKRRCPHFETLPPGHDYLAMEFDKIRSATSRFFPYEANSNIVARVGRLDAWEHGVGLFSHLHGHADHLEEVDSTCFPVQRLVRVPSFDKNKDSTLLKKNKGKLYSVQDVEDMYAALGGDTAKPADHGSPDYDDGPRTGTVVVFGNPPDSKKLRCLARTKVKCGSSLGYLPGEIEGFGAVSTAAQSGKMPPSQASSPHAVESTPQHSCKENGLTGSSRISIGSD